MDSQEQQIVFEKMKQIKDVIEYSEPLHTQVKDIEYLDTILLDTEKGKVQTALFLVTEEIEGEEKQFYYLENEKVAIKDENMGVIFTEKFVNHPLLNLIQEKQEETTQESLKLSTEQEREEENIAEAMGEKKEHISSYTEIDANAKVTATENFYQLVPEAKKFAKVAIVRTSGKSAMFHFVGITNEGKAKEFESLRPTEGINPSQEVFSMNRDGSKIESTTVSAMYLLKGEQDEGLSIKLDQYGEIQAQYIRRDEGTDQYIASPIETRTQRPTTYEVREMMDTTKNTEVDTEIKKAQEEEQADGSAKIQNINDNNEDDENEGETVRGTDGTKINLKEIAERERVSLEELKRKIDQQSNEIPMEEKIDNAIEEINEEYRHPDSRR